MPGQKRPSTYDGANQSQSPRSAGTHVLLSRRFCDSILTRERSTVPAMLPYEAKYLLSSMGVLRCFDADADYVRIIIADDFASITVTDDGEGMTPFSSETISPKLGMEVVVGLEKGLLAG